MSNNKELFRKELVKSLKWLKSYEIFKLHAWLKEKFYLTHGDIIKDVKKTYFKVLLPVQKAEISLIRNGKKIAQAEDKSAEFIVEDAGAYRVEVYIHNKAWIYSNHIRIGI